MQGGVSREMREVSKLLELSLISGLLSLHMCLEKAKKFTKTSTNSAT